MGENSNRAHINLKKLRTDRGWAQWETAEKLGVSREYISAVENGKRGISMSMMKAIIQVFGVKYEDFYT
ncbi:MAG: helix-turn-helix transcriptional regulator [Clostridiales bacterium]|nr:helix-turn-helix transcriptional regulator [Clostridiales bacterium]